MKLWPSRAKAPATPERREPYLDIRAASPENPSTNLANPDTWLFEALGGGPSIAGPSVNEQSSMRAAAVFACVSVKAGIIASLPLMVYQRTPQGRQLAQAHRLYPLLHDAPNEFMSAFSWLELLVCNLLQAGNHYSVIEYDNAARVVGFIPVMPHRVTPLRVNGRNRYRIRFEDGLEELDQEDVIHVPGLGFDGLKGLSRISAIGRDAISISLAMQEAVGYLHANGIKPSGVVKTAKGMSREAFARLRSEFNALYSGATNAGRTVFLDAGMEWTAMQLTPEDAQTLESRRFQVAEICRIYGVPPFLVGETDKTTSWGTGIEQQTLGFLKFLLNPDLCRIEGELNRKLFQPPFYCEFNREALNAMDAKTTAELFASGIQNARYTPNEVRRLTNLPDMPGGDRLYIQANLVPLDGTGQPTQPANPGA